MRKSISTILMLLCAASLAMAQAKTGAYSDKPVEIPETPAVQETVAAPAVEETVKSEESAEVVTATDQSAVSQEDSGDRDEDQTDLTAEPETPYDKLTRGTYKVNGKPDIESFFVALFPGFGWSGNSLADLDTEPELDKKNGYVFCSWEGSGSLRIQCCYWNRSDKKKMVGVHYHEHDMDINDKVTATSFICFFLYNEKTQMLEFIKDPFDEPIGGAGHLICQLPQTGKDIKYRFGDDEVEAPYKTLYFDGMKFSHTPVKK